jgi:hypothetical protein
MIAALAAFLGAPAFAQSPQDPVERLLAMQPDSSARQEAAFIRGFEKTQGRPLTPAARAAALDALRPLRSKTVKLVRERLSAELRANFSPAELAEMAELQVRIRSPRIVAAIRKAQAASGEAEKLAAFNELTPAEQKVVLEAGESKAMERFHEIALQVADQLAASLEDEAVTALRDKCVKDSALPWCR